MRTTLKRGHGRTAFDGNGSGRPTLPPDALSAMSVYTADGPPQRSTARKVGRVLGWIGLLCLVGGVMMLSLRGGSDLARLDRRAVGFALFTALTVCAYTVIDGIGVRTAGNALAYTSAAFLGNAVIMALYGPQTPIDFTLGGHHFDANVTFTRGAIYKHFASKAELEAWLERNAESDGLWLKIAKKDSGAPTVSYAEALELALCFGWIDSQKRAHDDQHFLQRFTPRRPRGRWSKVNREKAEALIAAGAMRPGGIAEVEAARADGRWEAAYEGQRTAQAPDDLQRELEHLLLSRRRYRNHAVRIP